ncbi:MAG: restriction endonuclease subunit S, partial [Bacteroidales bacterium]|nr:restriction endonuclease subunit S [Bacteroidales bacterium]
GNLNTTVQPTLNIKSLVEMPIPFYGMENAEKVVAILSKIDDKIENNRKINDNLTSTSSRLAA